MTSGSVIAQHYRRHRHQEFLRFLKLIDAAVPKELDLHLVDNYATQTPQVKAWLLRHPRFRLNFAPTSGSWLNLVERWFAELPEAVCDGPCPSRCLPHVGFGTALYQLATNY